MKLPDEAVDDIVKRLRRVEGQVGGIVRMIESGRECGDVIAQVSAASRALDQAGFKLLATGMRFCAADEDAAADAGFDAAELERLFLKLA